jgi:hypothetical protein
MREGLVLLFLGRGPISVAIRIILLHNSESALRILLSNSGIPPDLEKAIE